MSEPENFLQRWSKRKLAKGDEAPPQRDEGSAQTENKNEAPAPPTQDAATTGEDKPFDSASLPPIETIDANTDVSAFLRPGVPSELSRAALRRAWSADPAIRDFVGLVENGWDFNDPNAMPGFGPITPAEVARLAAQLLGQLPEADTGKLAEADKNEALAEGDGPASAPLTPSPDLPTQRPEAPDATDAQRDDNAAPQKTSDG